MRVVWMLAPVASALVLLCARPVSACGGCFAAPPPPESTEPPPLVNSHRMALSISTEQTVLWDQIRYSGAPSEFAWVLPVKPGARVEVASDAWFDVLDAATQPLVTPPDLDCGADSCSVSRPIAAALPPGAGLAAGCGDAGEAGSLTLPDLDGVDVVSHGSAGPYEMVILRGDEPGALPDWLELHGYAIPEDVEPLIDDYVAEGFDFVALRLVPGAGIQQMTPVRVVQPGASPTLPLRMVAAGAGARVGLSLFVISETRYTTANFPERVLDRSRLSYDFDTQLSNYAELRDQAFDREGGNGFLSPFAMRGALFRTLASPSSGFPMVYRTSDGLSYTTIADAFIHQAYQNGETTSTDCAAFFDGLDNDVRRVVAPCDAESGECRDVDPVREIDVRNLACPAAIGSDLLLDDLGVALTGLHPRDVWVTRLDANLSRVFLDQDLALEPAPVVERSAFIRAEQAEGTTCAVVPITPAIDKATPRERFQRGMMFGLGAIGLLALARRLARLSARGVTPARSLQVRS